MVKIYRECEQFMEEEEYVLHSDYAAILAQRDMLVEALEKFMTFHAGHVLMLNEAKENCDRLVVALQSDPTIDRPEKNKPVQGMFERYVQGTDFIQQYVFPGGCLPSPARFRAAAQQAGLRVVEELAFGADYAETLRRWRERFVAERAQVLQQGYDERFAHIWEFYLAYCEAAFAMGDIDVVQYTLVKP